MRNINKNKNGYSNFQFLNNLYQPRINSEITTTRRNKQIIENKPQITVTINKNNKLEQRENDRHQIWQSTLI